MKKNKMLALVMTCFMGLTVVAPVFAQHGGYYVDNMGYFAPPEDGITFSEKGELIYEVNKWEEKDMERVFQFIVAYDEYKKDEDNTILKSYLLEQFSTYQYNGNGEQTQMVQAIIQQDVESFITLYDELMNGDKKISEKLKIIKETLSQFEIIK